MKVKELLQLPFFQKSVFVNYRKPGEYLLDDDDIKDIYEICIEDNPAKIPSDTSTSGYYYVPRSKTIVRCIVS